MAELVQYANGIPSIRLKIEKPQIRIGRNAQRNDICVTDSYASKEHAVLEVKPSSDRPGEVDFFLRDLGSTNHTYVNREKITLCLLQNDDIIHIGQSMFRFIRAEHETFPGLKNEEDTLEFENTSRDRLYFSRRLSSLR